MSNIVNTLEAFAQVTLDKDSVVRSLSVSNLLQDGAIEIDNSTYVALVPLIGRAKYVKGKIIPYEPPTVPVLPAAPTTRFLDIWLRCTADEAALLRQAIDTAPARENGILASIMRFTHGSEGYEILKNIVDDIWPASRVAAILAPSEV